ncbi:MAG: hypothetical protein JWN62_3693, partial [Acidimicrobiales bacterium]|nr:hypothetical protein [Acidimicrobiales bacterium]
DDPTSLEPFAAAAFAAGDAHRSGRLAALIDDVAARP